MVAKKIVVIGGGAAGMTAASQARRVDSNAEITVLEKFGYVSYGACGLPFFISGEVKDINKLVVYTPERFEREKNVKVMTHTEVMDIDPVAKEISAAGENGKFTMKYDRLVFAAGGVRAAGFGAGERIFMLSKIEDGLAIRKFIDETHPKSAAVIGAGFVGLETADAFRKLGLEVTVFDRLQHILPFFDEDMSAGIEDVLEKNSVHLVKGNITGIENINGLTVVSESGAHSVDFVLVSAGVRPAVGLAARAALKLGATGGIAANTRMQTSNPSIFVAGDCAEVTNMVTGKPALHPLGTTANKTGRVAGKNAAGAGVSFAGTVMTAGVKLFGLEAARCGLTSKEASAEFPDAVSSVTLSFTKPGYMPGHGRMKTKIIFSRGSGQILGAQVIGDEGAAKRIDVFSLAVQKKMRLDEIAASDLLYSPPFAPVWDPIIRAADNALLKK